jgi:hypothetical protein
MLYAALYAYLSLQLLLKPKFSGIEKIKTIGSTYMAASGLDPGKEPQVLKKTYCKLYLLTLTLTYTFLRVGLYFMKNVCLVLVNNFYLTNQSHIRLSTHERAFTFFNMKLLWNCEG